MRIAIPSERMHEALRGDERFAAVEVEPHVLGSQLQLGAYLRSHAEGLVREGAMPPEEFRRLDAQGWIEWREHWSRTEGAR